LTKEGREKGPKGRGKGGREMEIHLLPYLFFLPSGPWRRKKTGNKKDFGKKREGGKKGDKRECFCISIPLFFKTWGKES